MASSSSSPSFGHRWPYDAFISFRREDTSRNFTARLYKAFCQKGIRIFPDDELGRGEAVPPALLKAIGESRVSVVVLSENYGYSTLCLGELTEIVECRETKQQIVLPVFYKVDPSDVRHQRGSFEEALAKHEHTFKDETVQRWKTALNKVANLSGWHVQKGSKNKSKFIHDIVRVVSRIVSRTYLNVAKFPVGMESHVREVNMLLSIGMNDTRMVGIFGVGGIGKTTIAKAVYNSIAYQFQDSCFLANVRETSQRENGLIQLQETLLFEVLGDTSLKVSNVDRGINVIRERLRSKRLLLVLDDVDNLVQLEALSAKHDWFGLGSRIIITTRDEHLLIKHQVDFKYKMNELDHNKAFQLFSWHAFQSDKPNDGFVEVTEYALHYAGGLPLALVVLGSDLHGKDIHYWKSALEKYKKIPEENIQEKLKISYDGLDENEKNIFLDIACFFKGEDVEYVIKIFDSCGFSPDIGIEVLMNKSLITLDEGDTLVMHDLLQDMGREIVRQESPTEPGKRSRLWFREDVRYVLEENMGTNKIEGILIELPQRDLINLNSKAFMKLKMLRLFINRNACFSGRPGYLSNELRLLDWAEYPSQSLPSNFHGKKLVVLRMENSLFKEPKEGFKNFKNMKIMEFSVCKFLTKIPDISGIPNLEKLTLSECESLVEVHDSVGFHDQLATLEILSCSNLISFPRSLKLRSLEVLYLESCLNLQSAPEIDSKMERLRFITLSYIPINELPPSLGHLPGLRLLCIRGCKNLMHLPNSILQAQHLENLALENCSELLKLPTKLRDEGESFHSVVCTMESEFSSSTDDGCSSMVLPKMRDLDLENCSLSKSDFLGILDCFSSLERLNLSGSDIVSLPACIKRFVGLTRLLLVNCMQLQEILELPPNIESVMARGCVSLESFPEVSKKYQFNTCELRALDWVDLSRCHRMLVDVGNPVTNPLSDEGHLKDYSGGIIFPGNTVPDWFTYCFETSNRKSCAVNINGYFDDIIGIAFCAVIGPIATSPEDPIAVVEFTIVGKGFPTNISRVTDNVIDSDHVWLEYSFLESSDIEGDDLRVEFSVSSRSLFFKSCGVHLIYRCEENAEDDQDWDHVDEPDEETENSVDSTDAIQLSKRRRDDEDDDDDDLESSCSLHQKKQSLNSGTEVSGSEDMQLDYS